MKRRRNLWRLSWALVTFAVLMPELARGQATRPAQPGAAPAGRSVSLLAGQSRVIETPWPVKRVSVGQPEIADVQVLAPDRIQIQGKAFGATEVTMWNAAEQSMDLLITVSTDLRALESQLVRLFPRSRITLEQLDGLVIVRGTLAKAEEAAQLQQMLKMLKLPHLDFTAVAGVHQVQLQVRVAEVSRSALRALGINAFVAGNDAFGAITIGSSAGPLVPTNIGVPADASATGNLPFEFLADTSVPSAVTLFGGFPSSDFAVFIQALQEDQFLQLLAEPKLVALSGEEATFLAGGEFPIPVLQGSGDSSSVTIEYKEFGVHLAFRPTVLGDGRIRLLVAPEVSQLSDVGAVEIQGFRIPSVMTRRVKTTIELGSGQTFGLAGLISRQTNARTSKVPGLGDLPVLGALFRSVRYNRQETELVVLVTPSLVEPLSVGVAPMVPGEDHREPDAWELYVMGRIEGKAPARVHNTHSARFKELGLDGLQGPGAWASYERQPSPRQ